MDYTLFELISHLGNILGIYMLDMINHIGLVQCQGRFSVNNNPFLPFPPHKSINGSRLQLLVWYFSEIHSHWWQWCIICIYYLVFLGFKWHNAQ